MFILEENRSHLHKRFPEYFPGWCYCPAPDPIPSVEPVDADEGIAGVGNRLPAGGNLPQSPSRSSPIFSYPPIYSITSLLFILISLPLYLLRFYTMPDDSWSDFNL